MSGQNAGEVRYNVVCMDCGFVSTPAVKSPLWWQAHQRAKKGLLDALPIRGDKCGCAPDKQVDSPDKPFCVFGYDDLCRDFSLPFSTFTGAVKQFLELKNDGMLTLFISGVSDAVARRLEFA